MKTPRGDDEGFRKCSSAIIIYVKLYAHNRKLRDDLIRVVCIRLNKYETPYVVHMALLITIEILRESDYTKGATIRAAPAKVGG